jgi:hypothetical protein
MKNDSKDIKRGSQCDHASAVKPSLTAKKKSIDATLPFADEAKEDEQVQKERGDHKAGQGHNIMYHVSSKEVVVEHEEPAPPTHPGAVAVGGSGYATSSSENERFLDESYGIDEQPLAIHGIEEGQHQQEAIDAFLPTSMQTTVMATDTEAEVKAQRNHSMINIMISCGLTCLVAIVAVVLAVVLTQNNKPNNPTLVPTSYVPDNQTLAPTFVIPSTPLYLFLSNNSFDNGVALLTNGTPQQQAMVWLESEQGPGEIMYTAGLLQIYALVTLYYATSGDQWFNSGSLWLLSTDNYCDWFGLKCDANRSQVISIDLTNNTLMGFIPPEIGLLSTLGKLTYPARDKNKSLKIAH